MFQGLGAISDGPARDRIRRYLECLLQWSTRINLTGAANEHEALQTLVMPVLGAEGLVSGLVVDVGSGNGSPGLILAALLPGLEFTLLEPRAKRWAFLREAVRAMDIGNVRVVRERSEAYSGVPAATITMRAVGLDPLALRPLLAPRGCVLVFGGPPLAHTETIRLAYGGIVQRRCFT